MLGRRVLNSWHVSHSLATLIPRWLGAVTKILQIWLMWISSKTPVCPNIISCWDLTPQNRTQERGGPCRSILCSLSARLVPPPGHHDAARTPPRCLTCMWHPCTTPPSLVQGRNILPQMVPVTMNRKNPTCEGWNSRSDPGGPAHCPERPTKQPHCNTV